MQLGCNHRRCGEKIRRTTASTERHTLPRSTPHGKRRRPRPHEPCKMARPTSDTSRLRTDRRLRRQDARRYSRSRSVRAPVDQRQRYERLTPRTASVSNAIPTNEKNIPQIVVPNGSSGSMSKRHTTGAGVVSRLLHKTRRNSDAIRCRGARTAWKRPKVGTAGFEPATLAL